jgi:hypothetical protein
MEWQQKIEYMYKNERSKLINTKEDPSEIIRKVSSWMFENTYKTFRTGNDGWSIETAVLDTYERTLYKLQRLLVIKKYIQYQKCRA